MDGRPSLTDLKPDDTLDCIGLYCPVPVIKTKEAVDKLAAGQVLEVLADDPAAPEDMKAWAKRTGNELLSVESTADGVRFLIRKTK
ncbi:MAG: sulfurtransferase TusA family protein [Chloroflexota bacterium]|nr:MAG: sulfurtransferase TusA family protein [Chloroflexota bacterium]